MAYSAPSNLNSPAICLGNICKSLRRINGSGDIILLARFWCDLFAIERTNHLGIRSAIYYPLGFSFISLNWQFK